MMHYNYFYLTLYLLWETIPHSFARMFKWKTKQLPLSRVFTQPCPLMVIKHNVFVICFFCRLSSSAACVFQASISQPPRYCSRLCHSTTSVQKNGKAVNNLQPESAREWELDVFSLKRCGRTVEGFQLVCWHLPGGYTL